MMTKTMGFLKIRKTIAGAKTANRPKTTMKIK